MTREENAYFTTHRHQPDASVGQGPGLLAGILEHEGIHHKARGGGSPSNHDTVAMYSSLVGLQHNFTIMMELGITEVTVMEHTVMDNSRESKF